MSFFPFFQWCDATAIGAAIRNSRWLFPLVESIHLLGLTVLLGTVIVLDLRLLGLGLRRQPVARVAAGLSGLMAGSVVVMLGTGLLLFLSEALKCYASPPFRVKMLFLFTAILFHYTAFRAIAKDKRAEARPILSKLVGVVSFALWMGVGLAGRAIGFY
jgi:uncharacterized protein YacL